MRSFFNSRKTISLDITSSIDDKDSVKQLDSPAVMVNTRKYIDLDKEKQLMIHQALNESLAKGWTRITNEVLMKGNKHIEDVLDLIKMTPKRWSIVASPLRNPPHQQILKHRKQTSSLSHQFRNIDSVLGIPVDSKRHLLAQTAANNLKGSLLRPQLQQSSSRGILITPTINKRDPNLPRKSLLKDLVPTPKPSRKQFRSIDYHTESLYRRKSCHCSECGCFTQLQRCRQDVPQIVRQHHERGRAMIRKFIKQKTSAPGSVEIKSRGGIEYTIETSGARFSCANLGNHFVVHRKHKTVMRLPTIRVKTEQEPQPQTRQVRKEKNYSQDKNTEQRKHEKWNLIFGKFIQRIIERSLEKQQHQQLEPIAVPKSKPTMLQDFKNKSSVTSLKYENGILNQSGSKPIHKSNQDIYIPNTPFFTPKPSPINKSMQQFPVYTKPPQSCVRVNKAKLRVNQQLKQSNLSIQHSITETLYRTPKNKLNGFGYLLQRIKF